MRKFSLAACLIFAISFVSFAQSSVEADLQRSIKDLKKMLPSTKAQAKVDLLNTIIDMYQLWDDDDQMQVDSASPFAIQAYNEAKRINYKRGKGYATLKLAYFELLRAGISNFKYKTFETGSIKKIEEHISEGIKISTEVKDQVMVGSASVLLGRLENLKGNTEQHLVHLKKGIELIEKHAPLQPKKSYREKIYTGSCIDCTGHEFRMGELYSTLEFLQQKTAAENLSSLNYYQKAGANFEVGNKYMSFGYSILVKANAETAIQYFKKAISYYNKVHNENGEFNAYIALCNSYFELGDFEKGLDYSKKSMYLAERIAQNSTIISGVNDQLHQAYLWMGKFYSIANDFETAFAFMRKSQSYNSDNIIWVATMAEIHRIIGNNDSAMHYINNLGSRRNKVLVTLSSLHISMHEYDSALILINDITKIVTKNNNLVNLGKLYANGARAYYGKKDYSNALINARMALDFTKKTSHNLERKDNYKLLSDIFYKLGKYDSAYFYLTSHTALKDSLLNRQLYIRLNDYKKQAEEEKRLGQIKLLQKDNLIKAQQLQQNILLQQQTAVQLALLKKDYQINGQELLIKDQELQLKDQTLKEQQMLHLHKESALALLDKDNKLKDQRLKQQSFTQNALIGGLLLFLTLGFFVYRYISLKQKNERLRNEKRQAELQQQSAELEMQALRAQMNPHFIFNCLSSINKFILKNESRAASDYLTRFSRLIRTVLVNSQLSKIPLSDEIEMLRLYLEMERLRFNNSFEYTIILENAIEPESVYIPPMILQPICENAIWHGLMHKEGGGKLDVRLSTTKEGIECVITDNGIGRKRAAELKSKNSDHQKSFGVKITTERLALFNQQKQGSYEVRDISDGSGNISGTSVRLLINTPSLNTVREKELV